MGGQEVLRTANDEIIVGMEYSLFDECEGKGRVAGSMLKPDLVRLRLDSGGDLKNVVVDVKVTSTDKMNKAFKEKDDKYREWAKQETREREVEKAVMVPLIISLD